MIPIQVARLKNGGPSVPVNTLQSEDGQYIQTEDNQYLEADVA